MAVCKFFKNKVHRAGVRLAQTCMWLYTKLLCIFFNTGVFYHQAGDSATMGRCSLPKKIPVCKILAWCPWCPTLPTLPTNRMLAVRNLTPLQAILSTAPPQSRETPTADLTVRAFSHRREVLGNWLGARPHAGLFRQLLIPVGSHLPEIRYLEHHP